jgi:hypothetical protein
MQVPPTLVHAAVLPSSAGSMEASLAPDDELLLEQAATAKVAAARKASADRIPVRISAQGSDGLMCSMRLSMAGL